MSSLHLKKKKEMSRNHRNILESFLTLYVHIQSALTPGFLAMRQAGIDICSLKITNYKKLHSNYKSDQKRGEMAM